MKIFVIPDFIHWPFIWNISTAWVFAKQMACTWMNTYPFFYVPIIKESIAFLYQYQAEKKEREEKTFLLSIYFVEINSQKQSNLSLTLCEQTHLEIPQLKIEYLYNGSSLYLSYVFNCELSKKILPRELTHPVLPKISDLFLSPF